MKAIVNTAPGELAWLDRPLPAPGPQQVRIRTAVCGICATDLKMIAGWTRTGCPAIPGHEWSGVVEAVGANVDRVLLGRPCVADNVLSDGGEVGFEHPGGYGQFLLTESGNVRILPDGFPLDHAALIEPLAVCVRAMRRLRPAPGTSALIFGDGAIGLLMLALLKRAGASAVTLVGGRAARLAVAEEFGAAAVVNHHEAGVELSGALARAGGQPYANVIEASGSPAALAVALDLAAKEGKVLIVGDYETSRADFPWNHMLHRELELIGSNASAGAWDRAVTLATSGELPLGRLISHLVPPTEYARGLELVRHDKNVLKVLLDWRQVQP